MPMLKEPWKKYKPFKPLHLPNRQWPNKVIDKAPRWLSSCLRDGNQSLPDPMNGEEKWRYFKMLCDLGYKEIEVSFPSASQTDFDFTRRLIETPGAVPDDVFLQVLSPCRPDLICRTVESVRGAKNAIIHIYLATSECFRQVVFGYSEEQTLELAVECTKLVRSLTKDNPDASGTRWQFEFSPECFSDTYPDYALRVCRAVKAAWGPNGEIGDQVILNLPATVELSTPNVYADLVEYFCNNIGDRENVILTTIVDVMAGADRVEGCLFGNGERTGNVDLVTLALNLYTQGVSPHIDFSDLNSVIEMVESCTKIPVHQRAPYGGSLVCAAFSGSHQDAIKKGFQNRQRQGLSSEDPWHGMPYLPLDPQDIGRNYEAIIRVNSQSGKGGTAFILQAKLQLDLPRGLQVAFSKVVQRRTEELGRELLAKEITQLFETTYFLHENPHFSLVDYSITPDRSQSPIPLALGKTQDTKDLIRIFEGVILVDGKECKLRGRGNGPISSMVAALKKVNIDLDVHDYKEHAIGEGRGVKAASYIECKPTGSKQTVWGVGIHEDVVQSSLIALLSAASNFTTSRPISPTHQPVATAAPQDTPSVISVLEQKANASLDDLADHHAFQAGEDVLGELYLDLCHTIPFQRLHPHHDLVYQRSQCGQLHLGDRPALQHPAPKRELRAAEIAELDTMVVEEDEITTADAGVPHGEGMELAQRPSRVEHHVEADAYGRRRLLLFPDVDLRLPNGASSSRRAWTPGWTSSRPWQAGVLGWVPRCWYMNASWRRTSSTLTQSDGWISPSSKTWWLFNTVFLSVQVTNEDAPVPTTDHHILATALKSWNLSEKITKT
ncbi:hypothetical protein DL764_007258 [Monosporascus ibericus]|uniref:2-isopropylmalate synthase n=1 Tax=Monosporascus ibericus TaxID=155417 RepID=A0A4Q4T2A0_9PEZI|nr:hypothetical protein DL764_007258 [Monosporascus ibericus]